MVFRAKNLILFLCLGFLGVWLPAQAQTGGYTYVTNLGTTNVSAYGIDADTGALNPIPGVSVGAVPRSVTVDPSAQFVYVANTGHLFAPSSISAFRINPLTGGLAPVPGQPFPFNGAAMDVAVEPTGQFAYVVNAGGNVVGYTINPATGALAQMPGAPFPVGNRPVALAIDPSGQFVYVGNAGSIFEVGSLSALRIDPDTGALTPVPGSPYVVGQSPLALTVDPTGRFLYAGNGGSNILAFTINAVSGALTPVPGQPFAVQTAPQSVVVDPTGQFLYAAMIGNFFTPGGVAAFRINAATGALTAISGQPYTTPGTPQAVATDPAGQFLYVLNSSTSNISVLAIDPATGALTVVPGPLPTTGPQPSGMVTTWGPAVPATAGREEQ